jgi:hypothetical protein
VYLSCGSSGRPPDYLETLFSAFSHQPYRLLVTTAGRWQGEVPAANIRVVDFIPGEWVLKRAQVLVGVVGIGAIYQALSCGVPVIGAPEHLDQEYHLRRIAALGLGIKLDRRAFAAPAIIEAVGQVLADPSYRRRCAPFVRHLEAWSGGDRAAELIDSHFNTAPQTYRAEDPFLLDEEEFLRSLDASTPASLPAGELRSRLRAGIRRGLPHRTQGKNLLFDRLDSWNWLYDRDPRFFGADYRALEQKRLRSFALRGGRLHSRTDRCRYRITYTYRLIGHEVLAGRRLKLFLPYPIHRPGQQEDIHLLNWAPAALKGHWAPHLGFFYGYTFVPEGAGPWEFGYTCELSVREQRLERAPGAWTLEPGERRCCLELEPGLLQQPEIASFRRTLPPPVGGSLARARAIYDALAGSKRFKKTRDRTHNLTYSTVAVLQDTGGHCITLAQAFIALCRAEGIPAREATGALLGYPAGGGRYLSQTWGEQIFGHTWAEVHTGEKGWVPVEFHSIAIGEQAMTAENVDDPELRVLVRTNTPHYRDYYFGNLDHQRLVCSNSAKRIPQCLVEDPSERQGSRKRWQVFQEVPFSCALEAEEC